MGTLRGCGASGIIHTTMRRFLLISLLAVVLVAVLATQSKLVYAQIGNASDMTGEVNNLRASYGLSPYAVDGSLAAIAQSQSDYQASIRTCTHTRADGSGPVNVSAENIGCGANASVQFIVYNIWSDDLHLKTMVGCSEGSMGVGLTVVENTAYYTLDVLCRGAITSNLKPIAQAQVSGTAPATVGGITTPTPAEITPVETAAPQPDGSIVHIIQPGQSMWAIANAYGAQIVDLAALNNFDAKNPVIYPGQKIVIRQAFTPTISPTITETPIPPTRTTRPTYTPWPTRATPTATITRTPTPKPLIPKLEILEGPTSRILGITMIVICSTGLLGMLILGLRGRGKDEG
jgi:uncharacterized protein YkwD/LysM repeat protein